MWTWFFDMHSGGRAKLRRNPDGAVVPGSDFDRDGYTDITRVYVELPEAAALAYFEERFGRDPYYVTCDCCGEDYSTTESDTLAEATGYERGCAYEDGRYVERHNGRSYRDYIPLDEYIQQPNVLVIPASEIN